MCGLKLKPDIKNLCNNLKFGGRRAQVNLESTNERVSKVRKNIQQFKMLLRYSAGAKSFN